MCMRADPHTRCQSTLTATAFLSCRPGQPFICGVQALQVLSHRAMYIHNIIAFLVDMSRGPCRLIERRCLKMHIPVCELQICSAQVAPVWCRLASSHIFLPMSMSWQKTISIVITWASQKKEKDSDLGRSSSYWLGRQ